MWHPKSALKPQVASGKTNAAPRRNLPGWYYRLVALTVNENRDVCPEDFDEDISDLEETNSKTDEDNNSIASDGKCDSGTSECESKSSSYGTNDSLTERSYDGSDADYYYELKGEREERKRELWDIREREIEAKEAQRKFESKMEKEVQQAYGRMEKSTDGDMPSVDLITSKHFSLYSVDHVDHCYNSDMYPPKYVEFYHLNYQDERLPGEATQIDGHVYFNADCGCDLTSFTPPRTAGQEEFRLKSFHGEYELVFQFISNDYLIMTVGRELVFMDRQPTASAPKIFRFMGIRFDREKEAQRQRAKRKRSASPRETWFEMNHPMGSWNTGGW